MKKMIWVLAACSLALSVVHAQPARQDYRLNDARLKSALEQYANSVVLPVEAQAIADAWVAGELDRVRELADLFISAAPGTFPSEYYAGRLRADGHYYKYKILVAEQGSPLLARTELLLAVENGHGPAAEEFVEGILTGDPFSRVLAYTMKKSELQSLLRTGAMLGGPVSATALGFTQLGDPLDEEEKLYWMMLAVMREKGTESERRTQLLNSVVSSAGEAKAIASLRKYAVTGIPFPDRGELPGRGIEEVLFVESDLRHTMGLAAGMTVDFQTAPPESLSIGDQFDILSTIVKTMSTSDVYLLYFEGRPPITHRTVKKSKREIMAELNPGDRVFVNCGGLAHVAVLYRRSTETGELLFLDPLHQFWQPSHNSCVTSYQLKHERANRYLTVVKEAEVEEMLQAAFTFRRALKE
jgi:hypothetical protein